MTLTKKIFIGLVAGGYAGAIIAILFINKSRGKKFRKNLEQKSQEYFDETNKYFAGTKNKTGDLINEEEKKILNDDDVIKSELKTKLLGDKQVFNEASTYVFNSGNETSGTETERIRRILLRSSSQK